MNSKKIKILLTAILVLVSALSINLFAFATEGGGDEVIFTEAPTPVETQAPAPVETQAPAPVETQAPAPVETQAPAPVETQAPAPVETQAPAPVETQAPAPVETQAPAPTNSYRPTIGSTTGTSFYITLVLNNDEEDVEVSVDRNGNVAVPVAPKKEGFKFDGWYSDEELTEKWDFLTSKATRDTVLYAKWSSLQDVSLFSITVSTNLGGVVTVTPNKAQEGEIVTIKVKPDKGNQLVENSLSVNGKFIEGYTFEMPANNVIVEAQFESIDAAKGEGNSFFKNNIGKIITVVAIAIVVIAIVVWFVLNRERFLPEEEEDDIFFVEPMAENEVIRRDDFSKLKRSQLEPIIEGQEKVSDNDELEINESEIRRISKTGRINLDQ